MLPPQQYQHDLAVFEQHRAEGKVRCYAEVAVHLARHAALLKQHADSPILTALLHAHAPRAREGCTTCDGCAPCFDRDYGQDVQPCWPCPTWSLIEHGA
jgi:hypothetical protein